MELKGKKICFLGDSITEGAVASKIENCYWKKLGEKTGANVLGFGIGGKGNCCGFLNSCFRFVG